MVQWQDMRLLMVVMSMMLCLIFIAGIAKYDLAQFLTGTYLESLQVFLTRHERFSTRDQPSRGPQEPISQPPGSFPALQLDPNPPNPFVPVATPIQEEYTGIRS